MSYLSHLKFKIIKDLDECHIYGTEMTLNDVGDEVTFNTKNHKEFKQVILEGNVFTFSSLEKDETIIRKILNYLKKNPIEIAILYADEDSIIRYDL